MLFLDLQAVVQPVHTMVCTTVIRRTMLLYKCGPIACCWGTDESACHLLSLHLPNVCALSHEALATTAAGSFPFLLISEGLSCIRQQEDRLLMGCHSLSSRFGLSQAWCQCPPVLRQQWLLCCFDGAARRITVDCAPFPTTCPYSGQHERINSNASTG